MEHRLRKKHLLRNPDTNAGSGIYLEKKEEKRKLSVKNRQYWEHGKTEKMKKNRKKEHKLQKVHLPRLLKKKIFV